MKRFLSCLLAIPLWPVAIVGLVMLAISFPMAWVWSVLTDP